MTANELYDLYNEIHATVTYAVRVGIDVAASSTPEHTVEELLQRMNAIDDTLVQAMNAARKA